MSLEFNLKNIIEYKYCKKGEDKIHIGYGIDNNYARCMSASITSFYLNNKKKNITFHVIASDLSDTTKEKLKELAKKYLLDLIIYEIDIDNFKQLPIKDYISLATYFRFMLPVILKGIDKLFYVDADIICIKDANSLFEINLENNIIAAVPDIERMNKKRNKILELENHIYFNAGLIVIDIKKWNENNISERAMVLLKEKSDIFLYQDQDVLNKLLTKKIKYMDRVFNCIDIHKIDFQKIILLHFANTPKPWSEKWKLNRMYNSFTKNLYNFYEEKTPWEKSSLEKIKNKKVLLKIYIKYILYKLFKYS